MLLSRPHLTVLLNALYDSGTTRITVRHPSDLIGDFVTIELDAPESSQVRIECSPGDYADRRGDVDREYGGPASDELPSVQSYVNAFLAGGLIDPANGESIATFLQQNGSPDLTAGHRPVLAGFDTNLLPWRIADVLNLEPGNDGIVNGFALATGVRDELDWDYKRSNTAQLEAAFGTEFAELWNQPAGSNREGRLGELNYRQLRDHRYSEEVVSEKGDEEIITGYDSFQREGRKDVLLFSNDRDFVERARSHRVLAQWVELPQALPRRLDGSWLEIQNTLYMLTVLFGVVQLPKVTLYGVWRGKDGGDWHDERVKVDCRSPLIEPKLERDLAIIEAYEE